MQLLNHTPFPTLAFESLMPDGTPFHTVVLRQTLEWRNGYLVFAETQAPLATTDRFYAESNQSSVAEESDLAPYKPMCDVLISGFAYAPKGSPTQRFSVGVQVIAACTPPTRRDNEGDAATGAPQQDGLARKILLHHRINVTGPRDFKRLSLPMRWANTLISFATLGLVRPSHWKLCRPAAIASLPIRYEYTWGGQCRVDAGDRAAARVPKASRLSTDQRQSHPDGAKAPAAHSICEQNPVGAGYAEKWFIKAAKPDRIRAPQLELPGTPITARAWIASLDGKGAEALRPVGLGAIGKAWSPRRSLAGTFDEGWMQEQHPNLPQDFRFEYWNCAHPAMQVPHLKGDETLVLLNLVPAGTTGSTVNAQDDTEFRIQLPGHLPMGWVYANGTLRFAAFLLDTVRVDLSRAEAPVVTLVWRATLPQSTGADRFEARFIDAAEKNRLASTPPNRSEGGGS